MVGRPHVNPYMYCIIFYLLRQHSSQMLMLSAYYAQNYASVICKALVESVYVYIYNTLYVTHPDSLSQTYIMMVRLAIL